MNGRFEKSFENYTKAVNRLSEAMQAPETDLVRDASIQRFEFTYELLWKMLKAFLEEFHGIRTVSPRQVFQESYALNLLEDETVFLDMMEARNRLAHTYNEQQAIQTYRDLPRFLKAFQRMAKQLP